MPSTTSVVDLENPVICPYCGPKNLKPIPTYTPFRNINSGDFVLMKPCDPFLILVWLGRTHSDVVKDDPNEFSKWWVLVKKESNLDEQCLYEDCWNDKWKCDLANLE